MSSQWMLGMETYQETMASGELALNLGFLMALALATVKTLHSTRFHSAQFRTFSKDESRYPFFLFILHFKYLKNKLLNKPKSELIRRSKWKCNLLLRSESNC